MYYTAGMPASGAVVGVVDFENIALEPLADRFDMVGGYGFSSEDPAAFLSVRRSVWGWGTENEPPTDVLAARAKEPTWSCGSAWRHIQSPRYVAYHVESATVFLGGEHLGADVTVASGDGGETWARIADASGRLYFLSDKKALYMQTEDDLFTLPLPTATSDGASVPTAWATLKAGAGL